MKKKRFKENINFGNCSSGAMCFVQVWKLSRYWKFKDKKGYKTYGGI